MLEAQTANYQTKDARADIMKMARQTEAMKRKLKADYPINMCAP